MSVQGLSDKQTEARRPDGWSVKHILAHVAMWEEVALSDMRRAVKPGGRVSFCAGHVYSGAERFGELDPVDNRGEPRPQTKLFEGEPDYPEDAPDLAFTARELRLMCRLAGLKCLGVYGGIAGNYSERRPQRGDWELILLGRRP